MLFRVLARARNRADYTAAGDLLKQTESLSDQQMLAFQLSRIQSIWRDCVWNVVYYRNLVAAGAAPAEIQTWDDVQAIPLLTRKVLQERSAELCRVGVKPDSVRMTGGSTGEPVRLGTWKCEDHPQRVAKVALWRRCGYQPQEHLFLIWGHLHLLGRGFRRHINHCIRIIKDVSLGYKRVDAYCLSKEKCDRIARKIIRFRPVGLIGYASALDYFVRQTEAYHPFFGQLGLKFVMPASEMPPHPDTYALLKQVFRCPIVQEFGGVEFGQVAMKFDDEPYRVFHHLNYVEGVKLESSGTDAKDLVISSLYDRYFPLIRYVPGDQISACTRLANGHISSFLELRGRSHDVVKLSDGAMVHSMAILHSIHQESDVLNIQLVLLDSGPLVRLAVRPSFDANTESRIRNRLKQISTLLAKAPFERVSDVKTTIAGKRRWIDDQRSE
jgi:phenylacetate-CoA ligase